MKRRWLCGILAVCMLWSMVPGFPLQTSAYEDMSVTQELVDFVKKLEGFHKYPYDDYSQKTVGYGSKCPDDKYEEYMANGIPEEEAEALLRQDMDNFEKEVNDYAKKWGLTFKQNEFDALVSLSFNCGGNWKWDAYGILNNAIKNGVTGNDLVYAFSLYSKAHTDYLLIRRRLCEVNMFLNGEYKAYNKDQNAIPSNYKWVFLDGNGGDVTYAIHGYDANEKPGINTTFTKIPTGVDGNGTPFVYEFAGWYTDSVGGTLVESLDGSLANATVLYAQWRDPAGNIVTLPKGQTVDNLNITITDTKVNVRSGPGTYYPNIGSAVKGTTIVITEIFNNNDLPWGKFNGGWISLAYTDYEKVLESLKPAPTWPQDGTVKGINVNVRADHSTSSEIKYKVSTGQRVTISETYDDGNLVWGKLADGNWICMDYVILDSDVVDQPEAPHVTGITLVRQPTKTDYVQMQDVIDPQGSLLQVSYSDGSLGAMTLAPKMMTFSNANLGETTVQVSYEGFTTSFKVNVVKATVTFVSYDGTVLNQNQYAYGETVTVPDAPAKPADEAGEYRFVGWSPEVTACKGSVTYTARFELITEEPTYLPGDFDGNETVDENDADYLLGYLLFPEWYPISIPADLDGNETVDENDADYLLGYLLFPEWYPLNVEETELETTNPEPSEG